MKLMSPKFSFGPSKPPEDFCRICGDKLSCIGKPGCHHWIEYYEWYRFHQEQRKQEKNFWLIWIGILLLAIAITASNYFYDDLVW
jgi:hypothetical protein